MKYTELEEMMLKSCSFLSRSKGKEIYEKNLIEDIYGKKVNELYHVYGKVKINDYNNFVQVHIKINLVSKKLIDYRCSCKKYKDFQRQNHNYYCEHLAAIAIKFLNISKGKVSKQSKAELATVNKELIAIIPRLSYKSSFEKTYFEVDFYLQNKSKYPITDLQSFINVYEKNTKYNLANNFILTSDNYTVSEDSKSLYLFIKSNIDKVKIKGNKIRLLPKELENFFNFIDNKYILFKDNYLEYITKINRKLLPLAFNLNLNNKSLVVTSEKNLPVLLDNNGSITLFNREFYLLNKEKGLILKSYISKLQQSNLLYFPGNNSTYSNILNNLCSISSKINLSKSLKDFMATSMKFTVFLNKKDEDVYAEVYLIIGNIKINLEDDTKLKEYVNMTLVSKTLRNLESFGFLRKNKVFLFSGNDEDLYNILFVKDSLFNNSFNVILDDTLMKIKSLDSMDFKFSIYKESLGIKFSYGFNDFNNDELPEVYNKFIYGEPVFRRKDGDFINLKDEKLAKAFNLITSLGLEKDILNGMSYLNKSDAVMLESLLHKGNFSFIENINNFNGIVSKLNNIDIKKLELKPDLKDILKMYQLEGVAWLNTLAENGYGGILADDMGLGKTVQILSLLSLHQEKKALIVTPTSLIFNWLSEVKKYTPWLKVGIIRGEKSKREKFLLEKANYNIFITTYGTLKNDSSIYEKLYFDFCIIDEAQSIKNYKAQITEKVKAINSNIKFALTGTPMENNLIEIWSIFDFIMPGYLFSKDTFKRKFESSNKGSLNELRTLISPFILRRTKSVLANNLPLKLEERVLVHLKPNEMNIYKEYFKGLKVAMNSGENMNVLASLTKLRQICLHPKLVDNHYNEDSSKLLAAKHIIKDCIKNSEKILIFSQFTTFLDLLEDTLQKDNINYFKITGNTKAKDRLKLVNKYNLSKDTKVFLISLKAGGTGLNLTSASVVLHLDPWWNIAVENQASDRAHRIGQTKNVKILKLIAKNTIEDSIVLLQEDKNALIEDVLCKGDLDKITVNKEGFMDILNKILGNNK